MRKRFVGSRARRIALAALLLAGCEAGAAAETERTLSGGLPSLDRLGDAAWEALAAGDTARMERLRLTEREHNERVWPALPAARPEIGMPVDFAWKSLQMRNHWDRARLLERFRGSAARVREVRCASVRDYPNLRVHSGCVVHLREPSGVERSVRIFKDAVELQGEWKLFRYQID